MKPIQDLLERWRVEAETLRRCGATEAAVTTEARAEDLEAAMAVLDREMLSLQEAADVSGYSTRRLRQMVDEGSLENHGRKGAPLFRRSELPQKPRTRHPPRRTTPHGGEFDPSAEALRIVSGRS